VEGVGPELAALIERLKSPSPAARPSIVDVVERLAWLRERPHRRRKQRLRSLGMGASLLAAAAMTVLTFRVIRAERAERQEAAKAKQVAEFLTSLFETSDPTGTKANSVTAREILDRGAQRILKELADQPEVQASLLDTLGRVYRSLALYPKAEELLLKSLALREKGLAPSGPALADTLSELGEAYSGEGGRAADAILMQERALRIREQTKPGPDPKLSETLDRLAWALAADNRYAEGEKLYQQSLALHEQGGRQTTLDMARTLNGLAALYDQQGHPEQAEPLYLRALSLRESLLGRQHPEVAVVLVNLGVIYKELGRYPQAERAYQRVLEIWQSQLGPDHPDLAQVYKNLARLYQQWGRPAEAESAYRRALAIIMKAYGAEDVGVAKIQILLGIFYRDQHRNPEAEAAFHRGLALLQTASGDNRSWTSAAWKEYAKFLEMTGRPEKAAEVRRRAEAHP
jgi:tetratricopeptide (TPR) repeat protein